MTASMVTPDNAPRDVEALASLSRAVRYRLVLNMGMFEHKSPEEQAFMASDGATQASTVLQGLLLRDQSNGQAAAPVEVAPAIQPGAAVIPTAMSGQAPPPVQEQQAPPPVQSQQMAPPPLQTQTPGTVAPAALAPGVTPPAATTPAATPAATRQPATQADPGNAGATAPAGPASNAMAGITKQLKKIHEELEACAGTQELEELDSQVKGLLRMNKYMMILLLEIGESTLGADKETLSRLLVALSESGELEELLEKSAEGK